MMQSTPAPAALSPGTIVPSASTSTSSWSSSCRVLMSLLVVATAAISTTMAFAPPLHHNNHHHANRINEVVSQPSSSSSSYSSSLLQNPPFRLQAALFARPGRPSASANHDEDEDDEDTFDDDDEEEEDDDFEDEDDEIGSVDDEDEEEEDEILMYEEEEDDEEEVVEAAYEEEVISEDEVVEEDDEEYLEEEGEEQDDDGHLLEDGSIDIWSTYDASKEDPPTPLLDDVPSDPNYKRAKEAVLKQVSDRKQLEQREKLIPRNFENEQSLDKVMQYIANMPAKERAIYDADEDIQQVEKIVNDNKMLLDEQDIQDLIIQDEKGFDVIDPKAISEAGSLTDVYGEEAFPSSNPHATADGENLIYPPNGSIQQSDLIDLDNTLQAYQSARDQLANQTYFGSEHTMAYMDVERDWNALSNETQDEILTVIEHSTTMACPEPEMWLMYDWNFNVSNLILASFRHNPEAPIMFTQWMPQLEVYEKYQDQRERGFKWTWTDVENADMSELEKYYKGIGYDDIPKKDASETGIITLDESEMDDEEREMMALENWMDEVFNEESENLMFDSEDFEPRDNVFDEDYGSSSTDGTSAIEEKFMKEFDAFEREFSEEGQEWRDQFATVDKYEYKDDIEGQKEFRGHLVIACTAEEEDLMMAEKITERFGTELGKAVFVETRVLGHARQQDQVFEIWLESYDIDLLHSKRQAFINSKLWTGPSEINDEHLEYLVDKVKELISDDQRYSYRFSDFADIKA